MQVNLDLAPMRVVGRVHLRRGMARAVESPQLSQPLATCTIVAQILAGGPHDSVARRMAKVGQRARGHFGNYVRAHAPQSDARTTACHATITAHTESNPQQ